MSEAEQERRTIKCAYCNGSGRDRWNLMSSLSTCSACGGRGYQYITVPYQRCPHCGGTGSHPHLRMTCTTCGGAGSVHMPADATTCPVCAGAGIQPKSELHLACTRCGGTGWVVIPAEQMREVTS